MSPVAQTKKALDAGTTVLGTALLSAMLIRLPFGPNYFLMIVQDLTDDVVTPLIVAVQHLDQTVRALCLRRSELYQLALLSPISPQEAALSYCVRHHSILLYGLDIRHEVPYFADERAFLESHIELSLHQCRSRTVLGLLAHGSYSQLIQNLQTERRRPIFTALLSRGFMIEPSEGMERKFAEVFVNRRLIENQAEAESLATTHFGDGQAMQDAALRAVWLFEEFLRTLATDAYARRVS